MSRIVSQLKPGAGVVTTRAHVHFVVTEHGIADLFGKNLRQRAEALIAVADPRHRDGADGRGAPPVRELVGEPGNRRACLPHFVGLGAGSGAAGQR